MGGKQSAQKQSILSAILQGQLTSPLLAKLLSEGFDVNERDQYGETALMKAAKKGQLDMVRLLVEEGKANVGIFDKTWHRTALMWAAFLGHLTVVKYLIDCGRPTFFSPPSSSSSMSSSSMSSSSISSSYAPSKGSHIRAQSEMFSVAPIKQAPPRKGSLNTGTKQRKSFVSDIQPTTMELLAAVDKNGRNAFHLACHGAHLSVVRFFLFERISPVVPDLLKRVFKDSKSKKVKELLQLAMGTKSSETKAETKKKSRKVLLARDGITLIKEGGFFSSRSEKKFPWGPLTWFELFSDKEKQCLAVTLDEKTKVFIELQDAPGLKIFLESLVSAMFPSFMSKTWVEEYANRISAYLANIQFVQKELIELSEWKQQKIALEKQQFEAAAAQQYETAALAKSQREKLQNQIEAREKYLQGDGKMKIYRDGKEQEMKIAKPTDGPTLYGRLEAFRLALQQRIVPLSAQELEFMRLEQYDKAQEAKIARDSIAIHLECLTQQMERVTLLHSQLDDPLVVAQTAPSPVLRAPGIPIAYPVTPPSILPPAFNPEAMHVDEKLLQRPELQYQPLISPPSGLYPSLSPPLMVDNKSYTPSYQQVEGEQAETVEEESEPGMQQIEGQPHQEEDALSVIAETSTEASPSVPVMSVSPPSVSTVSVSSSGSSSLYPSLSPYPSLSVPSQSYSLSSSPTPAISPMSALPTIPSPPSSVSSASSSTLSLVSSSPSPSLSSHPYLHVSSSSSLSSSTLSSSVSSSLPISIPKTNGIMNGHPHVDHVDHVSPVDHVDSVDDQVEAVEQRSKALLEMLQKQTLQQDNKKREEEIENPGQKSESEELPEQSESEKVIKKAKKQKASERVVVMA